MLATSATVAHAPFYVWTCPSMLCCPEPRVQASYVLVGAKIRDRATHQGKGAGWGSVMGKKSWASRLLPRNTSPADFWVRRWISEPLSG